MADLVVTVPKWFWRDWIAEGDAAGEPESREEWGFFLGRVQACTIGAPIAGFRGWRRRWWDRSAEVPFPDWRTRGVA